MSVYDKNLEDYLEEEYLNKSIDNDNEKESVTKINYPNDKHWFKGQITKEEYQYNRLFADNTPDYYCRVHQINYYVKKYIPEVYYSFRKKKIPFDIIYSGWILTMFGNYININNLDFPWTCFFIDK